jgi:hypothetical protein
MRVYTVRNYLTAKSFVKEVLNYCENKPKFVVDKAPWLIDALKSLGLDFQTRNFSINVIWLNPFSALLNSELSYSSALSQLKIPLKTGICFASCSCCTITI